MSQPVISPSSTHPTSPARELNGSAESCGGDALGPARGVRRPSLTILHIVAPGPVGGLERVVHALAVGHRTLNHDVHVAVVLDPGNEDHPFLGMLDEAGVGAHPIVTPARAYGHERRALGALLRRLSPQVVHTHGYRSDVIDAPVARRHGVPVVSSVHGFTRGGWRNRLYERLQRRAYRSFDAVVAVSRQQVPELLASGVRPERLHVVPNGFGGGGELRSRQAARNTLGLPPDARVIGWVGRLGREKGADVLLDALGRLEDLPLVASFIGDGAERAALEAQAARLGLTNRVHWHGMRRDAAALMPAFDLFALSSRTEGTPIALFEAMYAGVPIVATRVGGVPDVVSEAEALLVEPESPDALAAALRRAIAENDPTLTRATKARERLADFAAGPWLAAYEALYRSLLPEPEHPTGS